MLKAGLPPQGRLLCEVFRDVSTLSFTLRVGPVERKVPERDLIQQSRLGQNDTAFGLLEFVLDMPSTQCRNWISNRTRTISGASMTRISQPNP